jgi:hypothetical protein
VRRYQFIAGHDTHSDPMAVSSIFEPQRPRLAGEIVQRFTKLSDSLARFRGNGRIDRI